MSEKKRISEIEKTVKRLARNDRGQELAKDEKLRRRRQHEGRPTPLHRSGQLPPCMERYTASLAYPRNEGGARVPFNVNNILTSNSTTATTTSYLPNWPAAASTTNQVNLMPGHGVFEDVQMKAFGASACNEASATDAIIGPLVIPGFSSTNALTLSGAVLGNSSIASTSMSDLPYTTNLPYTVGTVGASEARWRLESMGVRVTNITVALNKGGTVVTCQPSNKFSAATQKDFMDHPSFTVHGVDTRQNCKCAAVEGIIHSHTPECEEGDGAESGWITWKPRSEDVAYWAQAVAGGAASTTLDHTAMWVWMNADAAQAQTFSVELVFNWEIAGYAFRTVVTQSPHSPLADVAMPVALAASHNTSSPGSSNIQQLARIAVASTDSGYNDTLHKAMGFLRPALSFGVGALTGTLPEVVASEAARFFGAKPPGRNRVPRFGK